jgi:soluble lytic murein transglycosylase
MTVGIALLSLNTLALMIDPPHVVQAAPPDRAPASGHSPGAPPAVLRGLSVATPPPSAPPPPPAPARPRLPAVDGEVFHPDRLVPYFTSGPAVTALGLLKLGKAADAASALAAAAAAATGEDAVRLRFLHAHALAAAGRHAEAAVRFEASVAEYPALADVARYHAARGYFHARQHEPARRLLATLPAEGPLRVRALILLGHVERRARRLPDAQAAYERYLREAPAAAPRVEALFRLAEVLLALPEPPHARAVGLLQEVEADAAGTDLGNQARALLASTLREVAPPRLRQQLARPRCDLLLRRSLALAKAKRLEAAARDLAAARRAGACAPEAVCPVAGTVGRLLARGKQPRPAHAALQVAVAACRRARRPDDLARITYALGKVTASLGRATEAAALLERLAREHPLHSYADDALMQAASLRAGAGQPARADRLVREVPRRFPAGDQALDAIWQLAAGALARGATAEARTHLQAAVDLPAEASAEDLHGRELYWLGRVEERLGNAAAAREAFARVEQRFPLGWYAGLARVRRTALGGAPAARPAPAPADASATWRLGPDPVFRSPGFGRALELARLGLAAGAAEELRALGLGAPAGPTDLPGTEAATAAPPVRPATAPADASALDEDLATVPSSPAVRQAAEQERLWAAVAILDRAGDHARSHWLVRTALPGFRRHAPTGARAEPWRLAYPRAWAALLEPAARANGVPASLLYGLVREESTFNPTLVSHAGAVGLTQLLVSTAGRFRVRGTPAPDRAALKDPERNVLIGARYLGWLIRRFGGHVALAVAAYNAGENRVAEWLVARGHLPLDEFVEAIPFKETRHYVRRVLGSALAYQGLAPSVGEAPLELTPAFPTDVVARAPGWVREARRWKRPAKRPAKARRQRAR